MNIIKELFFYLIYSCILIVKIRSTKLNYCEIENLYCAKNLNSNNNNNNNLKLHVACNHSLNSKINNLDNKFFNGQIINLNDQLRHEIIKNLNKFRNRLASGKIKMHPKPASQMNAVEWDDELEKLSRISLEISINGDHIGCTATEQFPRTREIFYRINYFPNTVINNDDVKYVVEDVIRRFNMINRNSIAIGSDETTHIGCTLALHNSKFLLMRCIVNAQQQNDTPIDSSSLYREGVPCTECPKLTCGQQYRSLCDIDLKRVRRNTHDSQNETSALKPKSKHVINNDDDNDDEYDEDDMNDDTFEEDEEETLNDHAQQKQNEYGEKCNGTEDCHWPMVCEEISKSKTMCTCDESYYYYDNTLGTCVLDGYDMIDFIKQIVEEANNDIVGKIANNTLQNMPISSVPTIDATAPRHYAGITEKDIKTITHDVGKRVKTELDEYVKNTPQNSGSAGGGGGGGDLTGTIVVAVVMAILSLITWVVFIIFLKRLENSIDRKLEEKSGYRSGINSS